MHTAPRTVMPRQPKKPGTEQADRMSIPAWLVADGKHTVLSTPLLPGFMVWLGDQESASGLLEGALAEVHKESRFALDLADDPTAAWLSIPTTSMAEITKQAGRCGGRACVRSLRIPVWQIANLARHRMPAEEIADYFGAPITLADVGAALAYAARHPAEIEQDWTDNDLSPEEVFPNTREIARFTLTWPDDNHAVMFRVHGSTEDDLPGESEEPETTGARTKYDRIRKALEPRVEVVPTNELLEKLHPHTPRSDAPQTVEEAVARLATLSPSAANWCRLIGLEMVTFIVEDEHDEVVTPEVWHRILNFIRARLNRHHPTPRLPFVMFRQLGEFNLNLGHESLTHFLAHAALAVAQLAVTDTELKFWMANHYPRHSVDTYHQMASVWWLRYIIYARRSYSFGRERPAIDIMTMDAESARLWGAAFNQRMAQMEREFLARWWALCTSRLAIADVSSAQVSGRKRGGR